MDPIVPVMTSHGRKKLALEKQTSQLSLLMLQCTGMSVAISWANKTLFAKYDIYMVGFSNIKQYIVTN